MLILSQGAGHIVQCVTGVGGADLEPDVHYVDKTGTGPSSYSYAGVGDPLASITTATTTTLVAGASSTERAIERISLRNNHASVTETVVIQVTDGTHTATLASCSLAPSESLVLDAAGVWTHYDSNMGPYVGVGPIATRAEMEAGTSTTTVVTPGRQHYHPSACKAWGKAVGAGTSLTVNYNITSITDTGTGRLGVTIGTDFSSANYAIDAMVERTVTALTATGVEDQTIRNSSPAAGSFEIESYDQTAITFAAQDPQNYFWACFGDQ